MSRFRAKARQLALPLALRRPPEQSSAPERRPSSRAVACPTQSLRPSRPPACPIHDLPTGQGAAPVAARSPGQAAASPQATHTPELTAPPALVPVLPRGDGICDAPASHPHKPCSCLDLGRTGGTRRVLGTPRPATCQHAHGTNLRASRTAHRGWFRRSGGCPFRGHTRRPTRAEKKHRPVRRQAGRRTAILLPVELTKP